jgi:hypothetical protein
MVTGSFLNLIVVHHIILVRILGQILRVHRPGTSTRGQIIAILIVSH